jgi:putative ABC transport system permease protein
VMQKHHGHNLQASNTDWQLHLQPVNSIHTTLDYSGESEQGVDGKKIKYFLWVAGFILLMVYLNSINIANSKALTRYKEIGVRKASGGSRKQVFFQLMLESFIINLLAVILAGIVLHVIGANLNHLLDLSLPQSAFSYDRIVPSLLGLWVIGSLVAGLYPALWLTSFSPSSALKGSLKFKLKTAFARPLLVSQLVFCLIILSGILTIYYQLEHMREQELGLSLEDKLVVRSPMLFIEGSGNYQEVIHNHFTQLDGVTNVGVANEIPGNEIYWRSDQFFREGAEKSGAMYAMLHAGEQYLEVFGIELKAGRTFNTALEEGSEAIINEKARETLGFKDNEEALGQKLMYSGWGEPRGVEIVGVVGNYRQQGVNVQVDPLVLNFSPGDLNYYIVEVEKGQMAKVLPQIESTFTELFPTSPFEFYFLDEHFDKQYKSESQFVRLFGIAAFVAIIIAVMGIIGVTTQLIIQRNKEMSIRKILGASYENVFFLISKEYMTWLLSCFLLGIPLSYMLFSRWLDNFLLRIELGWWFFVLPALIVSLIFISSTIFLTVKTALVNPAETLKSE